MQVSLSDYQKLRGNVSTFQKTHRSRIYLGATITDGSGTAAYAYSVGTYYAFGYGQNDALEGINNGSAITTKATKADTTILRARTPNSGERVAIFGVSVRCTADSDAHLAALLDRNMRFSLRMNGKELIDLGTLGDLGGIQPGRCFCLPGPADVSAHISGFPYAGYGAGESKGVYFRDPVIWTPEESADSNLDVACEITNAVTSGTISDRAVAAAGVEETRLVFTAPTTAGDKGTFVNLFVRLHCEVAGTRGVNQ